MKAIVLLLCLASLVPAADPGALEARLREHVAGSPEAAALGLELLDAREAREDVFGAIRTAGEFVRTQPGHPRRAEVMVRLMEAYAAGSRHAEVVATGRQFLEIFPEAPVAPRAHRAMAEAYAKLGHPQQAAAGWASLGVGGDPVPVFRALDGYRRAENAQAAREGADFTLAVLREMPAQPWSAAAALSGMELAGRAEQWETGAAIGRATVGQAPAGELGFRLGEFESRLGNHAAAVAAMGKALGADPRRWEAHFRELAASGAPSAALAKQALALLEEFPGDRVAHEAAVRACEAWMKAERAGEAARFAEAVMGGGDFSRELAIRYVEACGEDAARAEKFLTSRLGRFPETDAALREALAVDLYQNRMGDADRSRRMAREWLEKSPAARGAGRIVACLIDQAAGEGEVREDLATIAASARRHPQIEGYWQDLWQWRSDDGQRRKWMDEAAREFEREPFVRLWRRAEKGGREGARACDELLGQSLAQDQRRPILRRRAHLQRHELGDKARQASHQSFKAYCEAFPKDRDAAEAWLEAAVHADEAARLAAARHLLSFPPGDVHPDTRLRVVEVGDAAHRRRALEWAGKCAELDDAPRTHAARIGRVLAEAGLEEEARGWWRSQYQAQPDDPGAAECLLNLSATMEDEPAAALLREALARPEAAHGPLAMRLAELALRQGRLGDFEDLLAETRRRRDANPFAAWHVGEWPARGWLEATAKSAETPEAEKQRIYRAIFGLGLGRVSAEAGLKLALLREPAWPRMLEARRAIGLADRHHESWQRIYALGLEALLRRDMTLAAVIFNGLLHSVGGVGEEEMDKARARLRTAYAAMGNLGSDIPGDSALAPLLEIVLNLRLGEREKAEQAYFERRGLFDEHVAELPVELLLFAAETHVQLGGEEDHGRAEELLRGWLVRHGESDRVAARDKARVQLLLARNYLVSQRYDVARAEYTTLLKLYPDELEAVEARFGIGETYMAQGIEEQAAEIFGELSGSGDPRVAVRADFMRGVLALRRDEADEARGIFLAVLEKAPEVELADSTLYHLAEVYGIEQRYLAQLETLRTVGRLGRESQRWLTPGKALAVVVQDPDLGISRGEMRLPVRVTTTPGGDVEDSHLVSGGAGRGIFLAEIPTMLGEARPGDGVLQVTGGDEVRVDYPEEFREQFRNQLLEGTRIRIATDGRLEVASREIDDPEEETFTDQLREPEKERPTLAEQRPPDQVKPGNLIHVRVTDGDRDLSERPDAVAVKLETSSGDGVRVTLPERSAHGGVFVGAIRTGELPAGARASDTALDHSPLMAIDRRRETSWRSEPDGKTPKTLRIDMKRPRPVEGVTLESPDEAREFPLEMSLYGSHDGRFRYLLARHPRAEDAPLPPAKGAGMVRRLYQAPKDKLPETLSWQDVAKVMEAFEPAGEVAVDELSWQVPDEDERVHLVVWSGPFVQPRDGAVRFAVGGRHTALMFDGRLELPVGEGGRTVDVFARKGIHELVAVALVTAGEAATLTRARENRRSAGVVPRPFTAQDFTLADGLEKIDTPVGGSLVREGNTWTLGQAPLELRHLEWEFTRFEGAGVAVNHLTVEGGGAVHVPTAEDVLELAGNDTLELAPGDQVTVSYLDEVGADGLNRNRLVRRTLTATYGDGRIRPVTYTFDRGGAGEVTRRRHELLRIEPGERIVAEVTDYDLDRTLGRDEVEIEVEAPDGSRRTIVATETDATTGVFVAEIETGDAGEAIAVAPGQRVILRYRDEQNNFPGHPYIREAEVLVNEPSDATLRVIASGALPGEPPGFLPEKEFSDGPVETSLRLPLTIEVIDPDRARHDGSVVEVALETTQGIRARVECVLSAAHSAGLDPADGEVNAALHAGRFVGQVPLKLGDAQSPPVVAAAEVTAAGGLGRVLAGEPVTAGVPVLHVAGGDTVTAAYSDERRHSGGAAVARAGAVFRTRGTLHVLDADYAEEVEGAYLGKKIYVQVEDPDLDISAGRDLALVRVRSESGEEETLELTETLSHSGVFNASFPLVAADAPAPGNPQRGIECFFGDTLTIGYLDNVMQRPDGTPVVEREIAVAMGSDGAALAFSKEFRDDELAIQTRFHIAECHFELFKSHRGLGQDAAAMAELEAGRRVLREVGEDYPDPRHAPRVDYLLGQFAQELEDWDEAVSAYRRVFRNHPRHPLAPEALYKMGQCHEQAGRLDEALEDYATLAATYPKSPLIANVMLRISEHFYQKEEYPVAASVGRRFLERFPTHEWAPRMAFRVGQALFKNEDFDAAAEAFDEFTKRFPDEELTSQGLFWAGESYRMAKDIPEAFRRYNRCRWDFPESEAAKYSRGRLALPELLSEFDRQADLGE